MPHLLSVVKERAISTRSYYSDTPDQGKRRVEYIHAQQGDGSQINGLYNISVSRLLATTTPTFYFFPASITSPFLHAIIFILGAVIISFDSILKDASFTRNVHTSSHNR